METGHQEVETLRQYATQLHSDVAGVCAVATQHLDQILARVMAPGVPPETKLAQIQEEVQAARQNVSVKVAGIAPGPPMATSPAAPPRAAPVPPAAVEKLVRPRTTPSPAAKRATPRTGQTPARSKARPK